MLCRSGFVPQALNAGIVESFTIQTFARLKVLEPKFVKIYDKVKFYKNFGFFAVLINGDNVLP